MPPAHTGGGRSVAVWQVGHTVLSDEVCLATVPLPLASDTSVDLKGGSWVKKLDEHKETDVHGIAFWINFNHHGDSTSNEEEKLVTRTGPTSSTPVTFGPSPWLQYVALLHTPTKYAFNEKIGLTWEMDLRSGRLSAIDLLGCIRHLL